MVKGVGLRLRINSSKEEDAWTDQHWGHQQRWWRDLETRPTGRHNGSYHCDRFRDKKKCDWCLVYKCIYWLKINKSYTTFSNNSKHILSIWAWAWALLKIFQGISHISNNIYAVCTSSTKCTQMYSKVQFIGGTILSSHYDMINFRWQNSINCKQLLYYIFGTP